MTGRMPQRGDGPDAVLDPRVWRVVGEPLLPPTGSGPLDGHTVAVKDVFAVEGFALGAGVPAYLDEAVPQGRSAASLRALQAAGASVRGIARTDQFAYSIAGRNAAYGTPPNPAVPGAISGGSSSGPASAVAMGHASIGLATDTAGSIRIPASYQGLWGLRTTHGAVSTEGVLPLAPSFDTVGWLTRDRATLELAAVASLGTAAQAGFGDRFVTARALGSSATPGVAAAFTAYLEAWDRDVTALDDDALSDAALDGVQTAFRTVQAFEAWAAHGAWVAAHPGALGADVASRFEWAATVTPDAAAAARTALDQARSALDAALGDAVLVLPSAASVAPALDAAGEEIEAVRAATLRMTAVAGATGRPALSVPALTVDGAPVGVCFVGPRGSDLALVRAAGDWVPRAKRH
jgi:Asp-tRNA(Asn)/Glu-tRNA(Gln) amidotransferase A subunit family amidase